MTRYRNNRNKSVMKIFMKISKGKNSTIQPFLRNSGNLLDNRFMTEIEQYVVKP